MKKISYIITLISIISLFFVGCSSDDTAATATTAAADTNTRSNTPAKSSVSTPSSMSGSGSSSNRTATKKGDDADLSGSSVIYPMIKAIVGMMKSTVSMADLNLMLVDARIADGFTASTTVGDGTGCYEKGSYTINFTQGMYNSLVAQEEDFGGEEGAEGSMSADMKALIGTDMDGPVAYKYTDITSGGYTQEVSTGESCSTLNESFRWNTEKTKLASQFKDTMGDEVYKGTFTYNGDDNVSSFSLEMSGTVAMKLSLKMATCTGMTGDCAVYSFSQSFEMAGGQGAGLMQADGKADDSGGYATALLSMKGQMGNMKMGYKEYWEGDGAVTANATCQSNCDQASAQWTTTGTTNDTYAQDSYDSDGANGATVSVSGVTADGSYMLVITGEDPSTNPEATMGMGEIRSGTTSWEFWGPDKTIGLDVYLMNSDGTFTKQAGASVTVS